MRKNMLYSVVKDHNGFWHCCSFGGNSKRQERHFALYGYDECTLVTSDFDAAIHELNLRRADCGQVGEPVMVD